MQSNKTMCATLVTLVLLLVASLGTNIYQSKKYTNTLTAIEISNLITQEKTYIASCINGIDKYNKFVQKELAKYNVGSFTLNKPNISQYCKKQAAKFQQDAIVEPLQDIE